MSSTKAVSQEHVIEAPDYVFPADAKRSFAVKKLQYALLSLSPGSSSSLNKLFPDKSDYIGPYSPVDWHSIMEEPIPGFDESPRPTAPYCRAMRVPKLKPMLCKDCSTVHLPFLCPSYSCTVCYAKGHLSETCGYFHNIPQGADFNRDRYEVVCHQCGSLFGTDRWVCSCCPCPFGKLKYKCCYICSSIHHNASECTDKRAAIYKSLGCIGY